MASIEITMRHSDVRIEALKEYAQQRMEKLCAAYPKVTTVTCVIDIDVKKHMYMAEVVANRLGTTAVGAKEFSEKSKDLATLRPYQLCDNFGRVISTGSST